MSILRNTLCHALCSSSYNIDFEKLPCPRVEFKGQGSPHCIPPSLPPSHHPPSTPSILPSAFIVHICSKESACQTRILLGMQFQTSDALGRC